LRPRGHGGVRTVGGRCGFGYCGRITESAQTQFSLPMYSDIRDSSNGIRQEPANIATTPCMSHIGNRFQG